MDRKLELKVRRYTSLFREAVRKSDIPWPDKMTEKYTARLTDMYNSDKFREHNVYPTTDVAKVYAVIAMCLEFREYGLDDDKIIELVNYAFRNVRMIAGYIAGAVDKTPCCYDLVRIWNVNDHAKRLKDHSITYDSFKCSRDKVEYCISKCVYVEMFNYYGIKELCRIFCMTDEHAYANLKNHVTFVRHSDLATGDVCFDEIMRKGKEGPIKTDYKNWLPKGMVYGAAAGTAGAAAVFLAANHLTKKAPGIVRACALGLSGAAFAAGAVTTVWMAAMHRQFSYDGERQMSRQIVEGTAEYVNIPDGGTCLDVGCGSGALTIACAKRNPGGFVLGIDRWGSEYAFSKELCENNAMAEGVINVEFSEGDAVHLDFDDETFDAVTSNYVYHNIPGVDKQDLLRETLRVLRKGGTFAIHDIMSEDRYGDMEKFVRELKDEGYEDVKLIRTDDGMFMSKEEAAWMMLKGSALLVGRK